MVAFNVLIESFFSIFIFVFLAIMIIFQLHVVNFVVINWSFNDPPLPIPDGS